METQQQQKLPWTVVKQFQDADLIVRVQKLALYNPKFSIEIGTETRKNEEVKFTRFLRPGTNTTNGQVNLLPLNTTAIVRLIAQAEEYIFEELQSIEDRRIEQKQRQELKSVNWGKQEPRVTGKTARKKNQLRT